MKNYFLQQSWILGLKFIKPFVKIPVLFQKMHIPNRSTQAISLFVSYYKSPIISLSECESAFSTSDHANDNEDECYGILSI